MIELPLFFGFLLASAILIAIPGPNVMMIAAQSALHGRRAGLLVVLGLTTGQAIQVALVLTGLSAILTVWGAAYGVLKVLGALYLFWLASRAFKQARMVAGGGESMPTPAFGHLFRRGILVALANPKTMLFHAAFLPQFVSSDFAAVPQLMILAISFLLTALSLDSLWALGFGSFRRVLGHYKLRNGLNWASGMVYLVMGGFALSRRSS